MDVNLEKQDYAFWNSPLDNEELDYESQADNFIPVKNKSQLREMLIKAAKEHKYVLAANHHTKGIWFHTN